MGTLLTEKLVDAGVRGNITLPILLQSLQESSFVTHCGRKDYVSLCDLSLASQSLIKEAWPWALKVAPQRFCFHSGYDRDGSLTPIARVLATSCGRSHLG